MPPKPAQRGEHIGKPVGAPDQRERAATARAARARARPTRRAGRRGPTCARRRAASGETFCRAGSLNGGFISTWSTLPGASPRRANALARRRDVERRDRHAIGEPVARRVLARKRGERRIDLDQRHRRARHARREREPRRHRRRRRDRPRCSPGARMRPRPRAGSRRGRRGGRAAAGAARAARRGPRPRCVVGVSQHRGAAHGRARPRSSSRRARASCSSVDQDAARQHADRAFQHAHVLVEHQMADAGALEQRLDRRDQDRVVGADDLAHAYILSRVTLGQARGRRGKPRTCRLNYSVSMLARPYCPEQLSWPSSSRSKASRRRRSTAWSSSSPPTWSGSTPRSCRAPAPT